MKYKVHTVIMIHGHTLLKKLSSRSLWKVASFSTININLACEVKSFVLRPAVCKMIHHTNQLKLTALKYLFWSQEQ